MATVPASSNSPLAAEQAVVRSSLDRLARRIRVALWVRYASYAVLAGSILVVGAALVWRVGWLAWPLVPAIVEACVIGIYVVALAAASLCAFRSKIPLLAVARLADERQGLKQRLSSSLSLSTDPIALTSPFFRLHMADAAAIAPFLDARKVFPLRPRWEAVAAIISVLLAALATALALRSMGVALANGSGPMIVAQEGAKLAGDAQRIARSADAQKLPQTRQYADKLARLARQMQSRRMPQSEAVKRLSTLSAQVRQEQQQLAKQSSTSASPQGAPTTGANAANMPTTQKQTAGAPASLSDTLRKMADQLSSSPLTPSMQRQMAQALNQLAGQARSAGLSQTARHIDQASKALAQGKQDQAASELREAAKTAELEQNQALKQAEKQAQSQTGAQNNQAGGSHNTQTANTGTQQAQGQKAQSARYGHTSQAKQGAQGSRSGGQSQTANQSQPGQASADGQAAQKTGQSDNQASSGQQANGSDAQGMQSIERSLQQAEERLSGQSGPNSPNGANGNQGSPQKAGSGNGESPKPGNGSQRLGQGGYNSTPQQAGNGAAKGGAPSNVTQGNGKGSPTLPGKYAPSRISGTGYKTPQNNVGVWRGKPQQLDQYNPSRNSRYGRIYLPTSSQDGRGITRNDSNPTGAGPAGGQVSTVPYYQVYPQFKKSAEAAIGKEDIPRAYAKKVRQYFQSLTPPSAH